MADDGGPVDVLAMDQYEWRAWLRSVTPFIDGEMVRYLFKGYTSDDYLCSEVYGDSIAFWIQLNGLDLNGVFDYFTVHCIDWEDYQDAVFAVHTKTKSSSSGRTIEIAYWPHVGDVLKRLGYDNKEGLLENQWDGSSVKHAGPVDLVTVTAFFHEDSDRAVGESGNDLLLAIEHEINSAWFHEPADKEREALREESKKVNGSVQSGDKSKSRL